MNVNIIGAGLAGSEAAWQVAQQGVNVTLYEMRPNLMTPAHKTGNFAELVCSNSFRGSSLTNAVGLLKEEMSRLGSIIMAVALHHQVPAGGALAVDRERFANEITEKISGHPLIKVIRKEICTIPDGITIIATGPLTSDELSKNISKQTGEKYFYFYDAAAPIVMADSIDYSKVFQASRYDKGEADYINCPFTKEEYELFYEELIQADLAPQKNFETEQFFEGCMPIEQLAKRGAKTLLFGPMKPVGLVEPISNQEPYAVVQLRQDNQEGTLYNMVGFQTHLKWGDQKRIFSLIPGLETAEFARYGVMHRNTFINSPKLLQPTMQTKAQSNVFFAGQITGVEGYIESASNGLVAGLNAARLAQGLDPVILPIDTATGALCNYICSANSENFQPMKVNYGLLPSPDKKIKPKALRNQMLSERALKTMDSFIKNLR